MDSHINSLLATRKKLWDGLTSTTARYSGDVVDGTKDPHKYDPLVQMEDMIDREVERLYAIKREILDVILKMDDPRYRDVLMKRYVDIETLEQIAVEMNYSYMQVCRLHGDALIAATPLVKEKNGSGN